MLYVTGDTHGDFERFTSSKLKKLGKGDVLFICGDFGFVWDGSKKEEKMLKKIGKLKYNVCFVDGTHENFMRLKEYEQVEFHGGNAHHICGNLYHLMRGQVFDFDGTTVFTMGGGESPDIDIRTDGNSWSGEEIPTQEELLAGAKNLRAHENKIDIIVTHEPPTKIKGFLKLKDKEPVRVSGLNTYFEELGAACEYKRWFFGSMHVDKFISSSHIAVFQNVVNAQTGELVK
ncbi:MAG: metallophosphoesterase [Clostridia bacterium]|nr:metallophosphoesterase [Clostridia bacterium]MBQ7046393.1 metallophosphoesterase [Oscillospiraceae bacterium]